ncbi:MAG: MBL fold metallo-hydrolase [Proteobacteria bacterium]|nr:MBL fold metallo-hydrolase [Pseudomonadota bacterium]
MAITLTFHGACGIVTGSCIELRTSQTALLIDCGMFQGTKTVKELNYGAFPFDPASIRAVLLTHAHIDHCGLLPKLVRAGFSGPIVCTPETADLLTYVLPDSGYIQELEVEQLNRRNRRRGREAVAPIYTREDAESSLIHLTPRPYEKWIDIASGVRARFWNAAHILGSASIELEVRDGAGTPLTFLFSGDIGPGEKSFHAAPTAPSGVDYLFVESTYGDRLRRRLTVAERRGRFAKEIKAGLRAGGMILIPSFAIERTQELLVDLDALFHSGELPATPVFVDSPLAIRATSVFAKYLRRNGDTHDPFQRPDLHFVESVEQSKGLARLHGGAIIMAGSGMCDAGRIRHHLKNSLSRSDTTVILVGYQAQGSLGRLLRDGAAMVRIQGEEIAVAARIRLLDEYSGHADQAGLLDWVRGRVPVRQSIFLVHGEEDARAAFSDKLLEAGFAKDRILRPAMGQSMRISGRGARLLRIHPRLEPAAAASDWHNAYAETVLELRRKLEGLKSDKDREKVLQGLRGALKSPRKGAKRR